MKIILYYGLLILLICCQIRSGQNSNHIKNGRLIESKKYDGLSPKYIYGHYNFLESRPNLVDEKDGIVQNHLIIVPVESLLFDKEVKYEKPIYDKNEFIKLTAEKCGLHAYIDDKVYIISPLANDKINSKLLLPKSKNILEENRLRIDADSCSISEIIEYTNGKLKLSGVHLKINPGVLNDSKKYYIDCRNVTYMRLLIVLTGLSGFSIGEDSQTADISVICK